MSQVINFNDGVKCEINGRPFEIYRTSVDKVWTWRSGQWHAWDFRKGGEFPSYAEAAQDAMRNAPLQVTA